MKSRRASASRNSPPVESPTKGASVVAGVVSTSWSMGRLYDEHEPRRIGHSPDGSGHAPARPASLPVDGGRDQPVAHRVERSRTARRHADLGVDVLDVGAHRARRDARARGRSACWNDRGPAARAPRPREGSARPAAPGGGGPGDPRRRARRAPHRRRAGRRGTRPAAPTRTPAGGSARPMRPILPERRGRRRRRRRCGRSSGCRTRSGRAGTPSRRGVRGAGWPRLPMAASCGGRASTRSVRYGWVRTRSRSAADHGPALSQIPVETPSAPMSCTRAARSTTDPLLLREPEQLRRARRQPGDAPRVTRPRRRLQVRVVGERGQHPGQLRVVERALRPVAGPHRLAPRRPARGRRGRRRRGGRRDRPCSGRTRFPAATATSPTAASMPPNRTKTSASSAICTARITGSMPSPAQPTRHPLPSHRSNACDSAHPDGVAEAEPGGESARPSGSG